MRYYEREGLIEPAAKSGNGYRLFGDEATRRLHFIKQSQRHGFTIVEIREMLVLRAKANASCGDMRRLVERKKALLERKISDMKAMVHNLDLLLANPGDESLPVAESPIIAALERGATVINSGVVIPYTTGISPVSSKKFA